jgi:hypothetical protein
LIKRLTSREQDVNRSTGAHGGNRSFIAPCRSGRMSLSRRAVLASPLLAAQATRAHAADMAMLRPGTPAAVGLLPLAQGRMAFTAAGLLPAITLPSSRAHGVTLLPIAGRQVVVLGFGADPAAATPLDLGAIVGWDGLRLRVLALELLTWRAANGGTLTTRLKASGDRTRLMLLREASLPIGATRWRREHWIDLLAWRDGQALADAPVRVPPPDTWQARLERVRAQVAARLVEPCATIGMDLTALFAPELLPPA